MVKLEYEDSFVKAAGMLGGEEYVRVARALLNNVDATDEEIASATGLKINIVRRVLYALFERSLIIGIRFKDPKKGWYVDRWKAQSDAVDTFLMRERRTVLQKLTERLEYERSNSFYYCGTPTCKKRTFEESMMDLFKCTECGNTLTPYDNSELIKAIEWKINQINEEMGQRKRETEKPMAPKEK